MDPTALIQGPADATTNAANNIFQQIAARAGGARQAVEAGRQGQARRLLETKPRTPQEYLTARQALTANMDPIFRETSERDASNMQSLEQQVMQWSTEVSALAQEAHAGTLDDARHFERLGLQAGVQSAMQEDQQAHDMTMETRREGRRTREIETEHAFQIGLANQRLGVEAAKEARANWNNYTTTLTTSLRGNREAMRIPGNATVATPAGALSGDQVRVINEAWVNQYMVPTFNVNIGAGGQLLDRVSGGEGNENPRQIMSRVLKALRGSGLSEDGQLQAYRSTLSALALMRTDYRIGGGQLLTLPSR